jgi:hypothetical protein
MMFLVLLPASPRKVMENKRQRHAKQEQSDGKVK